MSGHQRDRDFAEVMIAALGTDAGIAGAADLARLG
jgi:hypothetical protein